MGSDMNYNRPSSLLVHIICFDPLRIVVSLTNFKTRWLGRGFHTFIKNVSFSSPMDTGSDSNYINIKCNLKRLVRKQKYL